jgi:hypothetical protein
MASSKAARLRRRQAKRTQRMKREQTAKIEKVRLPRPAQEEGAPRGN